MLKLSIIGCGNVAKTMSYLWHRAGKVEIVDVVNRSQANADNSVGFIGAGRALASIDKLDNADIFVIACGDDYIEACLDELLNQGVVHEGNIVFHFSGAKSSVILDKARSQGAQCASLHPVKSFANPNNAIRTFTNTYCALEGDNDAKEILETLIQAIHGHCFAIESDQKLTYHAASVFACNYLVALQELSLKTLEYSGVDRDLAMKVLEPIVKETSNNIFTMGTAKSLTGPIARGDYKLVTEQFSASKTWDKDASEIYRLLGKLSVELSDEKGISDKNDLKQISKLFNETL